VVVSLIILLHVSFGVAERHTKSIWIFMYPSRKKSFIFFFRKCFFYIRLMNETNDVNDTKRGIFIWSVTSFQYRQPSLSAGLIFTDLTIRRCLLVSKIWYPRLFPRLFADFRQKCLRKHGKLSINILRENFSYKRCFGSFFYIHVTREKLPKQCSYEKFVRKMLMKVTTKPTRYLRNIFSTLPIKHYMESSGFLSQSAI
jgi:hypothetical protein